jgi:FkbM family methyltransferase
MEDVTAAQAARESFLERAEEFTPLIAVDSQDARFLLSTFDHHITTSLFLKSGRGEMKILRRAIAVLAAVGKDIRRGTLIDVGANIGTTTIPALRRHHFAQAVACEPEPRNRFLLKLNLVANDLQREVQICPAAIADSDGEVEFLVSERKSGMHEVHSRDSPLPDWTREPYETITVRQVALDTVAGQGVFDPDDVALLWMDAEGHEGHILRGGESLTERGVPVVMELNPDALGRHGGLEFVKEVAQARYTHYVRLRQARGRTEMRFDLEPTDQLVEEIDWLSREDRFTDVLLVRDPLARPRQSGRPRPPSQPRQGVIPPDPPPRRLREHDQISARERSGFVKQARPLTPLLAARIDGATYITRTDLGSPELPLFVHRSHPRLQVLDAVISTLDELGLGEAARRGTLVEAEAGVGIATTAGLCRHGFARALACEPDASGYRALKLNIAANGLTERVRALPVGVRGDKPTGLDSVRFDDLLRHGLIGSGETGFIWVECKAPVGGVLAEAQTLLEHAPPLLLRVDLNTDVEHVFTRLEKTYSHFARVKKTASPVRVTQIKSRGTRASRPLAGSRGGSVYVLALRLSTG